MLFIYHIFFSIPSSCSCMKWNNAILHSVTWMKTLVSVDPYTLFTAPSRCLPYWSLLPTSNACLSATHSVSPIHIGDNLTRLSLAGLLLSLLAKADMLGIARNGCVQINLSQMCGLLWNWHWLTFFSCPSQKVQAVMDDDWPVSDRFDLIK